MPNLANILGLLGFGQGQNNYQPDPQTLGLLGQLNRGPDGNPSGLAPDVPALQRQLNRGPDGMPTAPFGLLSQPQAPAPSLPAFAQPGVPPMQQEAPPPMPPVAPGAATGNPMQLAGARPVVPMGGNDTPMAFGENPANLPAATAAPASLTKPAQAQESGFDKFGKLIGSIYGQGGPGDNLIALGAGLASGPNWGSGLMKGMSMVNANALTAKKKEDEQKRNAGLLTMAEAMSKKNGQPVSVNLGILQSGAGSQFVQDTFKRDTPQLVTIKDPITGVDRQEWVTPGQTSGTQVGGGSPVGGATSPAGGPAQPQNRDAEGKPLGLYQDPQGRNMYRTIDGREIPIVGNVPEAVKSFTEADQKAVAEAPVAYRNLESLKNNVEELKKHPGLQGWGGLTSMSGAVGEYVSPQVRDARSRLEQIKGQAFLQAFQQLKGAGAITEKEGDKAGQAIARLNDPRVGPDAFNKALDDLLEATQSAMNRLSKVPGVNVGQSQQQPGSRPSWRVVN